MNLIDISNIRNINELDTQGGPKKSLWSSLQSKLPHELKFFVIFFFYMPKNSKLLLNNPFLQTMEKVLQVSKQSQKAWS